MKHSIMVILVILFIVPLLSSCKKIPGNFPQIRTEAHATDKEYKNQLVKTPHFIVSANRWFDLQKFEQKREATRNLLLRGNNPQVMSAFENSIATITAQMVSEVKREKSAFVMLNFWINPNIDINFQQVGALTLTLKSPSGELMQVSDKGCLFTSIQKGKKSFHLDSAKNSVTFNKNFNYRTKSKQIPNVVCVRLDYQYFNWKVVDLELDPQKIFVNDPLIASVP